MVENIALPRYGVRKFLMVSLTISTETHGLESNKTLTFWVRPKNYCVVVFCLWDFSFYNRVDSKKLEQWNKHSLWSTQSGLRATVIFARPHLVLVPKPKYFSRLRPALVPSEFENSGPCPRLTKGRVGTRIWLPSLGTLNTICKYPITFILISFQKQKLKQFRRRTNCYLTQRTLKVFWETFKLHMVHAMDH